MNFFLSSISLIKAAWYIKLDVVYLSKTNILPESNFSFNSLYQVIALSSAYKVFIKYGDNSLGLP